LRELASVAQYQPSPILHRARHPSLALPQSVLDDEEPSEFFNRHFELSRGLLTASGEHLLQTPAAQLLGKPCCGSESMRAPVDLEACLRHTSTFESDCKPHPAARLDAARLAGCAL